MNKSHNQMNGFERTFRNKLSSKLVFPPFVVKKDYCAKYICGQDGWFSHRFFGRNFLSGIIMSRLRIRDWHNICQHHKRKFFNEIPVVSSTGEKPLASGESFNVNMIRDPTKRAMIPGAHKPHFSTGKRLSARNLEHLYNIQHSRSNQVCELQCLQVLGQRILRGCVRCSTYPAARSCLLIIMSLAWSPEYSPSMSLVPWQQTKR